MSLSASVTSPAVLGWQRAPRAAAAGRTSPTFPWAASVLSLAAAVLYLLPEASTWLSYDRQAVAGGQVWRLVTGHWTHWSAEHLGWSLLVFAVLGLFWERSGGRRRFLLCTLSSALLISAAVWFFVPAMAFYRGLSGVDCALVTALAAESLRASLADGRRRLSWGLALALAGYFAKVFYELTTGGMVFVSAESATFSAVPLAHLAGGLYGLVLGFQNIVGQLPAAADCVPLRRVLWSAGEP